MKRIISTLTVAGLLAGALLAPGTLRAEGKDGGGKGGKAGFAERMKEKFGISEEQGAKLKAARRARRDAMAAARAELELATSKLQDLVEDRAPEKELAAALDKIASIRKTMRAGNEKFEASLSSILTPTQRAKMLVAMKSHARGMRGGKWTGRRGGMRGGARGHGPARGADGPGAPEDGEND